MTFQPDICAVCGAPMAESLVRLGSVRCHDCRETGAVLTHTLAHHSADLHSVGTLVELHERERTLLTATQTDTARELAHRAGDGLAVTLVWYPGDDRVAVRVTDTRREQTFEVDVPPDAALDAFEHPFAYAPDSDAPPPGRTPALTTR